MKWLTGILTSSWAKFPSFDSLCCIPKLAYSTFYMYYKSPTTLYLAKWEKLLGRHNISPIMCLSISWFLGILSFLRFLLTLHIVYPLNFPLVLGSITKQQSCYSVTPALYRSCQKTASWSQIDFPLTRTFSPIPHY